jgi:ABC-type branched-subunit amino acid transport system substrate-binding protein
MKAIQMRRGFVIPMLFLLLGAIGISPLLADVPESQVEYRIGVLAPLSGNFASYGKSVREGIEKVRVPGVTWVFEDDACDPAKAVTAFKKLSSADGLSFFVGPCCGSPQKAVAPLLKGQSKLALLPSAAPVSVFGASGNRMYSAQYSLESDGAFLAGQMKARGLRKVAIVYVENEFSQAIEGGFLKAFDGEVAYSLHAPAFDVQFMKAAALALKKVDFDVLFIPDAAPLLLGFLSELKKVGVARRPAFSVYAAQMPDVITSEKENAEGLFYSYPEVPEGSDAFSYFPRLAAELLGNVVAECHGESSCVLEKFARNPKFKNEGVLAGNIVLKTIRDGQFVEVADK